MNIILCCFGIISAMQQEAALIQENIINPTTVQIGDRQFTKGTFEGIPVVFALAGVGKVSAAITTTLLITQFEADKILFTGVAGGGQNTSIGDIVVGSSYLQHDLDLRPVFPQFYIFSLGTQFIDATPDLVQGVKAAAERFLKREQTSFLKLGIQNPSVHKGTILSGDQFISSAEQHKQIAGSTKELLPDGFLAIEMEGAAVAQVCQELKVPFVVVRSISDKANHDAGIHFQTFMEQVAGHYSLGVLKEYFQGLPPSDKSD